MSTLSEWIRALVSDMSLLAGLQEITRRHGASQARSANIKAAQERIRQAKAQIAAMKQSGK